MHKAILQRLCSDPRQSLARFATNREGMNIVGAFRDRVDHPLWIAKTATTPAAIAHLRQERDALVHLQPWSKALNIPAVLDAEETEEDLCLIQGAVDGVAPRMRLPVNLSSRRFPQPMLAAMSWLEHFRRWVTPPGGKSLMDITHEVIHGLEFLRPHSTSTIDGLIKVLRNNPPSGRIPVVAVHGDFWWQNTLFGPHGIGVIDWDAFHAGVAIEDIFTFALSCCIPNGRHLHDIDSFKSAFFASTSVCQFVQEAIADCHLGVGDARFCFYFFIANRTLFKASSNDWLKVLGWLLEHDYPPVGRLAGFSDCHPT